MKFCNRIVERSREEFRLIRISAGVAFFLLIIDQLTKLLVEQQMTLGKPLPIIDGVFSLTYVTNPGAAWGMFSGYGIVLFIIGVLVVAAAIYKLRKLCDGYPERYVAVMTVISGVIGNSIDRIWRGEVVDFLDCWIGSYRWPTFNIADCAICIGIGIFMISAMFRPEPAKKDQPEAEKTAKQESAASDK